MSHKRQNDVPSRLNDFFSQRAVFTVEELDRFLSAKGSRNPNTRKSLLAYYRRQGRVLFLRRGLYATVPPSVDPESCPVDPYLVASKMAADAVLAYHTALEFHGKAYSVFTRLHYVSSSQSLPLRFRSYEIKRVPVPHSLSAYGKETFGVAHRRYSGVELQVTNLERTLVDVLDRPELSGSWEEIWRSLESIEFFDLDQVVDYARLLRNATTAAKVGFYLQQHREALMVDDHYLASLRELRPRHPHYLTRGIRKGGQLVKEWNLMVPPEVLDRSWEDVL